MDISRIESDTLDHQTPVDVKPAPSQPVDQFVGMTHAQMREHLEKNEFNIDDLAAIKKAADNDPQLVQTQALVNMLIEQFLPAHFNTQYAYQYLHRKWATNKEKETDSTLNREQPDLDTFNQYFNSLSVNDPRRVMLQNMMDEAEKLGFKRGTDYNIMAPSEYGAARLYGVKQKDDKNGFQTILGLAQGDRFALPETDDLNWETTTNEQHAAIMKFLGELENCLVERREEKFNSAYEKIYAKTLGYDDARKAKLKTELLRFAAARDERIQGQLRTLGFGGAGSV